MSRRILEVLARVAIVLYRTILRLYPAAFRDRCGAPMLQTFEQLCSVHVARGHVRPFVRAWMSETADAIRGIGRSYRGERSLPPLPRGNRARDSRIGSIVQDAAYALRRLRAQPSVVVFTVLTLGVAIAANAAIFSIVDDVLLQRSPFKDPDRLMTLMNRGRNGGSFPGISREKLRHWRTQTDLFEAVEGYRRTSVVITGGVEPEEVTAARVSPGLLTTLGVAPVAGRLFLTSEGNKGEEHVVILSERYWRARLGGAADAIGRSVSVNGTRHTIVGVMPDRFQFPSVREQVWLPFDPAARTAEAGGILEMIVRLAQGLTLDTARQRADAIAAGLQADRPLPNGWGIALYPTTIAGPDVATTRAVLVLFGAVALVLLTACANVANLLLSRAVDRQREFAIRLVLGASRLRLVRELFLEGVVLGLAAGMVGLLLARWAVDLLLRVAPESLVHATSPSIAIDGRVFAFTLAVSVLTGVVCNMAPAFRTARATGHEALAGRTRTSTETPFHRRLRGALVVAEVALAVILLVGAALMVRTFVKLNAVDIGFDPDDVLAVTVGLDRDRYGSEASRVGFLTQVTGDILQLPGVTGVALAAGLPPQPGTIGLADPETESGRCGTDTTSIVGNVVGASYFGLMGMRIVDGRSFRDDDPASAVVVSRSLASLCGGAIVGRRLRLGPGAPWMHVVGIAADVKSYGLTSEDGAVALYAPLGNDPAGVLPIMATMHERRVESRRLIIRAERPAQLIDDVKRIVWSRDPQQPILQAALATDLMGDSIRRERFMLTLMTLCSAVALALASAGIFGVLAYSVAQRRNEIGIRMALGASSRAVLRLVVGQALGLAGGGVAAGLIGAFALSRVLAGLLYEVDPRDPASFVTMPMVVVGVALLAAWIPTVRALRVDPASALRVE